MQRPLEGGGSKVKSRGLGGCNAESNLRKAGEVRWSWVSGTVGHTGSVDLSRE